MRLIFSLDLDQLNPISDRLCLVIESNHRNKDIIKFIKSKRYIYIGFSIRSEFFSAIFIYKQDLLVFLYELPGPL